MPAIYRLSGFNNYIVIDKVLYRLPYITKSVSANFQYRNRRAISRTFKDGAEGYWLTKNKTRKFYSLKSLKHRLIKVN
jgi:hypothetical protein